MEGTATDSSILLAHAFMRARWARGRTSRVRIEAGALPAGTSGGPDERGHATVPVVGKRKSPRACNVPGEWIGPVFGPPAVPGGQSANSDEQFVVAIRPSRLTGFTIVR